MTRRPPRSTRTDTLFPYTTLFRSTGWLCDERRGQHLRELVPNIPANRLMIDTDAPYLLPRTLSPKPKDRRNEPAFLPHIVAELARARGEDVATTAANRSEERREGKEWVSTCRSRWTPQH